MKNIHQYKDKKLVNKVFDHAYKNYDLMNDIMSLGSHRLWKSQFVESLKLSDNEIIIDMASGTGDITKKILEKNNFQSIIRVEPNYNMLNNNISEFANFKNVSHLCSYAENIPLKDSSCDLYLISFGLRNVTHLDQALKEAFRVLKRGGKFCCLEFYKVKDPVIGKLYEIYSKAIPFFGKIFNQNEEPYKYLVKSINDFYSQNEIKNKLEKVGFSNVYVSNIFGGVASIHYGWKLNG